GLAAAGHQGHRRAAGGRERRADRHGHLAAPRAHHRVGAARTSISKELAMLVSQKLATAAHLHVLLRRKTGRVTDTEWMAANLEYASEIIRFSRAKALEDGHADLAEWADKLERAVADIRSARSFAASTFRDTGFADPLPEP